MPTTTLSLKYRPIRIGFLVREGNIDDLVEVAGINTLLWGGVHNPIIPISASNKKYSSKLINEFSVDILHPIFHTKEIDEIITEYKMLIDPLNYNKSIFNENRVVNKNEIRYLDSLNIIEYNWEKEFKFNTKHKSHYSLVGWNNKDTCSNLFSIMFGFFPKAYNLKDDFENVFLKASKSKINLIANNGEINSKLASLITPLSLTSSELYCVGRMVREDGIYIGDENNFNDLMTYWNLRASGIAIIFYSKNQTSRFKPYIYEYLQWLDKKPDEHPNFKEWIYIYFRGDFKGIENIIKEFRSKLELTKEIIFDDCNDPYENNCVSSTNMFFEQQQGFASIEKNHDNFSVSFALPEKKMITTGKNRDISNQLLAISISTNDEFGIQGHTIKPPYLRDLNEFYNQEFNSWVRNQFRTEKESIGKIIEVSEHAITIKPISHQSLIEKIFELAGYNAKLSQAGLLAKQIVLGMREDFPLNACEVFQNRGTRELIDSIKSNEKFKWKDTINTIAKNNFAKFIRTNVTISQNDDLQPFDIFNYLLKKKIFKPVANISKKLKKVWPYKCKKCGLENSISIKSFEGSWSCLYCEYNDFLPPFIAENFDKHQINEYWNFMKSGLFSKNNNQEGSIPVILSLLTCSKVFSYYTHQYSTSLNLQGSINCEVDFCILQYNHDNTFEIGIAECKSKGHIDKKDVDNLKAIQDAMQKININCYLIFAKLVDKYEITELKLFENLKNEGRKIIILSNLELEAPFPYGGLFYKNGSSKMSAYDLHDMARNSLDLYL